MFRRFVAFYLACSFIGCASTGGGKTAQFDVYNVNDGEGAEADPGADGPAAKVVSPAAGLVSWCSSGGAPLVGLAVVDDRERAYVATSDGYLHAFERDGRFRWSYTVKGTPLGSVSLRPSDGVILIGTSARYLYAINQSGRLHWSFRTLSPVWSGIFALNPKTVVFVGHDRRLYALKNGTGGARYRVRAPGQPMGEPIVAEHNVVWLPLADGAARFVAAHKLEKFNLPSATEQLVVVGERAVARAGGLAYELSPGREPRLLAPARYLASQGQRVVLVSEVGRIQIFEWKKGPGGEGEFSQVGRDEQVASMSAAPVLSDSLLWIPQADGTLTLLGLEDGRRRTIIVGERPLSTPVLGKSGLWALVSDHHGTFCAVEVASR